mmetsp:Transcript_45767/g.112195  ORF Transcript_45767/g.112195 Transcript_45767/m.112195 type:complete len:439 (+) Transcript_45767:199-1515(+)
MQALRSGVGMAVDAVSAFVLSDFEKGIEFGDMSDVHKDVTFRNDTDLWGDAMDPDGGDGGDTLLDFHDDMLDAFDEIDTEISVGGGSVENVSAALRKIVDDRRRALAERRERIEGALKTAHGIKTRDKIVFVLGVQNVALTAFITGAAPELLPYWYTVKSVVLLLLRWYIYRRNKWHYFLFDFCYLVNVLTLVFLWGFRDNVTLFNLCCSFALGPLFVATITWGNSLVFHSEDKVTSVFIHLAPAMALYAVRFYPSDAFPLCRDAARCSISYWNAAVWPLVPYLVWQLLYYLRVEWWAAQRVRERGYVTSFNYLNKNKKSLVYRLCNRWGARHAQLAFMALQFVYIMLTLVPVKLLYSYQTAWAASYLAVFTVCAYNGGCYYIEVFARRYVASLPDDSTTPAERAARRSRRNTAASVGAAAADASNLPAPAQPTTTSQ